MYYKYVENLFEKEFIFEFGRKMACPHCNENISHTKGYLSKTEKVKIHHAGQVMVYAMVYLCPKCETILNIDTVGAGKNLFNYSL